MASGFSFGNDGSENSEDKEARFSRFVAELYQKIDDTNLSENALKQGLEGYLHLKSLSMIDSTSNLIILDLSQESTEERLYIIDVENNGLITRCLAAHGRNTGANIATAFSNTPGSLKTSLGFYLTKEKYFGKHGLSLRLDGLDKGFNDNARERAIVIHEADYVNHGYIDQYGRLGRSHGCPALPGGILSNNIEDIQNGTVLFIYYPQNKYLNQSVFLNSDKYLSYFSK